MTITIFCGDSYENWSPKSEVKGIGGSEEAVINVSRELSKLGHEVTVWNRCQDQAGEYDGVQYKDFLDYPDDPEPTDVFIGWRTLLPWKMAKNYKVGYHWLHDTSPEDQVLQAIALGAKKVMVLSKYHRRLYAGLRNDETFITQNGVNLSQFDQKVERVPYRIFWGSSYDRGLKDLLEEWPKIKLAYPDAELRIAYGWQTWESIAKQSGEASYEVFKNTQGAINSLMEQEGITHLGRISHEEVAKEMLSADVWAYPTWWPEISCITAMKAQVGGAIPVVVPTAALAETVQFGIRTARGYYTDVQGNIAMPAEAMEQWVQAIHKVLGDDWQTKEEYRAKMQDWAHQKFSWETVAKSWEAEFTKELQ